MEPKPAAGDRIPLGGRTPSDLDLLKINTAYKCELPKPPEPTPPEFLSPNGPIYKFSYNNGCIKIKGDDGDGGKVKGEECDWNEIAIRPELFVIGGFMKLFWSPVFTFKIKFTPRKHVEITFWLKKSRFGL